MSKARFSITYDGTALSSGAMDVQDLAPALLAVGQLFDAANFTLNGEQANIKVNVTAALNLKELLFGGGGIVVTLIW